MILHYIHTKKTSLSLWKNNNRLGRYHTYCQDNENIIAELVIKFKTIVIHSSMSRLWSISSSRHGWSNTTKHEAAQAIRTRKIIKYSIFSLVCMIFCQGGNLKSAYQIQYLIAISPCQWLLRLHVPSIRWNTGGFFSNMIELNELGGV